MSRTILGNGRGAAEAVQQASHFLNLSEELIVYIFSFCDVQELNRLSNVCRRFNRICNDDSVWRSAFVTRFGYSDIPLSCRLDTRSWRREYIKRAKLMRLLRHQRPSRMKIEPCIDTIGAIYIEPNDANNVILASLLTGFMRRCSTNGKLSREHISCSATQDAVPITCIDFNAMRAVCGNGEGRVTHVLLSKDVPARPRSLEHSHSRRVSCVKAVDHYAASGGDEGTVLTHDLTTHTVIQRMVHGSGVTCLALAAGVCVASGAADGSVCVWGWADGAVRYRWAPPKDGLGVAIRFVDVAPSGTEVVWADDSGTVAYVDLAKGEREILHRHAGAVTCMTVDWTAICVATGARDTLIKITRLAADGDAVRRTVTCTGHTGAITQICIDNVKVVSASEAREITMWDRLSGEPVRTIYTSNTRGRHNVITALAVSKEHVVFALDAIVRVWSLVGGTNDKGHRGPQPSSGQKLGKKRTRERRLSVQVAEEIELMHDERREVENWHMRASQHNVAGLSEEEMIAYALSLSLNAHPEDRADFVLSDEEAQIEWALRESTAQ